MTLPDDWRPRSGFDLVRLGAAHDGGYVVPADMVQPGAVLISMGLSDDWSFERDFLRAGGSRVICFDHSVTAAFWLERTAKQVVRGRVVDGLRRPVSYLRFFRGERAVHVRTRIGNDSSSELSLAGATALLPPGTPIALKVDIEGSEYRILDQVLALQRRLTGVAIEFHDVDLHRDRIRAFLDGLHDLEPAWLHGNNYGGVGRDGDPRVLEMSFGRRDGLLPHADHSWDLLSTPNDPRADELPLRFDSELSPLARPGENGEQELGSRQ